MTIFGRRLSEYVAFTAPFLGLILVVGIARLALSLGGVPNSTVKWFSVTGLVWIGVVYYSIKVHTSGFGSYKQLLVICALQNLAAQAVVISGIVLAILTGVGNIFSAPEYAFGGAFCGFIRGGSVREKSGSVRQSLRASATATAPCQSFPPRTTPSPHRRTAPASAPRDSTTPATPRSP